MTTLAQIVAELFDRTKWMRELQPLIDHLRTMHDGDPLPHLAAYVRAFFDRQGRLISIFGRLR